MTPHPGSQDFDFMNFLTSQIQELAGISTLIFEMIQNADDVRTSTGSLGGASIVTFDFCDDYLKIINNGTFSDCGQVDDPECPWKFDKEINHRCDFHRMKFIGGRDKTNQEGNTGAFGIGFLSAYQVTDHPELKSGSWEWTFYPERPSDQRIEENEHCEPEEGTSFRLPWAFDEKALVRKQLKGIPAIDRSDISDFIREAKTCIPTAIIFLKQIRQIQLMENGKIILDVVREDCGGEVIVAIDDKNTVKKTVWRLIKGEISSEAAEFLSEYERDLGKRKTEILIALSDSPSVEGLIYSSLPTEHKTKLPFHINADFFPTLNRKSIFLSDQSIKSKWNKHLIRSIANLLGDRFDSIMDMYETISLWDLIAKVNDASKKDPIDPSFEAFWDELSHILPEKEIVLSSKNERVRPETARLLESPQEIAATAVWEDLGIPVVHPDIRRHYSVLKELGTPLLGLSDIITGLDQKGITHRLRLSEMPFSLSNKEGIQRFLAGINHILQSSSRMNWQDREPYIRKLLEYPIALGTDGFLYPAKDLYKSKEPHIQKILPDIYWYQDLMDDKPIPSTHIPEFSVKELISYFQNLDADEIFKLWTSGQLPLKLLYQWLEALRDVIAEDETIIEGLRELPIWPAAGQLKPLTHLFLPGTYDDPLGIDCIISIDEFGNRREFLRDVLDVKTLDFPSFIEQQLPIAFTDGILTDDRCDHLIHLLLKHFGEINGIKAIQTVLQRLPIIKCSDGEYRVPSEVYYDNPIIHLLFGDSPIADIPGEATQYKLLYDWLGVAAEPRDKDILNRLDILILDPPTPDSKEEIATIFEYLGKKYKRLEQSDDQVGKEVFTESFSCLRQKQWLPGTKKPMEWKNPSSIYSGFRYYLFESQGDFLDVSSDVQKRSTEFLDFLVIKSEPDIDQIVKHLLYCCKKQIAVNREVYKELDRNSDDIGRSTIEDLSHTDCILIKKDPVTYTQPLICFWGDVSLGEYCYQLDESFREYSKLLKLIGVRDIPEVKDYIQILVSIYENFKSKKLDEETIRIAQECWYQLSQGLVKKEITEEDLREALSDKHVIPDKNGILQLPRYLFFEDKAGLAETFPRISSCIILRSEGWHAMEVAGVQSLSRSLKHELAEEVETIQDNTLYSRIDERVNLLKRIIYAELHGEIDVESVSTLHKLECCAVEKLVTIESISFKGRPIASEPKEVSAALIDNTLYYVIAEQGSLNWATICRELASFIYPAGDIRSLAIGIKEVLSANTIEQAEESLDSLDYPPFRSNDSPPPSETVTDSAGDHETGSDHEEEPNLPVVDHETRDDTPDPADTSNDTGKARRTTKSTSHLRSYVSQGGNETLKDNSSAKTRKTIEEAGINHVIAYEHSQHRKAEDLNKTSANHPGYDLESVDENGETRFIEVKSLSGYWDGLNPGQMTPKEFDSALQFGRNYWLYIVERANHDDDFKIYCIQDPANRVDIFAFDEGWKCIAETS